MIRIQLNPKERQQLQAQARQKIGRVSERIHFVLLSDQSKSSPEIGQLLGYNAVTVREWVSRYQAEGLSRLSRVLLTFGTTSNLGYMWKKRCFTHI